VHLQLNDVWTGEGKAVFFATAFRQTLELIQPPIQWILGPEADHSLASSDKFKNAWSYAYIHHTFLYCDTLLSTEPTLPMAFFQYPLLIHTHTHTYIYTYVSRNILFTKHRKLKT